MTFAPIPEYDSERVAALRALEILDTPPEERFDSITRLVTELFDVPISYVALVDKDRQWLKSRVGLELIQSERSKSLCGHAILEEDALVVCDTLADIRFQDNPMVVGDPYARFYAGQPLRSPDSHTVGTLCLMAPSPRNFDERERRLLFALGKLVERELALVETLRAQSELLDTKIRLLELEKNLANELTEAARYVRKLLPEPLEEPVQIDWVFRPSLELGGDAFGYHWTEEGELGLYLMDVCGHGVGPALLSVSVINLLKSRCDCSLGCSAEILTFLNDSFPMAEHNDLYFTMWLGVYDSATRNLTFSAAGHPPAIIRRANGETEQIGAEHTALPVGVVEHAKFNKMSVRIEPGDTLYVYSDGAYELPINDQRMMNLEAFQALIAAPLIPPTTRELEEQLTSICRAGGASEFPDDLSLLRVQF